MSLDGSAARVGLRSMVHSEKAAGVLGSLVLYATRYRVTSTCYDLTVTGIMHICGMTKRLTAGGFKASQSIRYVFGRARGPRPECHECDFATKGDNVTNLILMAIDDP